MDSVRAWSEQITIPTYPVGAPDPNPMFLEKRVYQGSSGVVYPYPVIDRIGSQAVDTEYTAVFLENRYLKIMLLPQLGGRVQMALDKTNGYPFVYYNRVIKPALVGLAGPWISGGIEFNWPQHHRPTTFSPLDWRIAAGAGGAQTVWCAEIEPMFNTKGMHGFTLHPERAYLEISVQLSNRTSEPQTFLWWANPAVHVNDDYQSVFPPDVHAVMDHGKRAVSTFPIATGTYYKINYAGNPAGGTDISRYKNIPVPTSYMAYHSDYDFVGDYDHGKAAGMLHIANHHTVPGKKQWTWGSGDFGQSWDRQLTDADGPYIELMCGAYTDNQPDFSWIMPGEEKSFTQIFMPYKAIGPASNANRDVVVHLSLAAEDAGAGQAAALPNPLAAREVRFGVYVTAPRAVTVRLLDGSALLYERRLQLDPETPLVERLPLEGGQLPLPAGEKGKFPRAQELHLHVLDDSGALLITFSPPPQEQPAVPPAATPARPPAEITSNEELFLNGLHLEQYRHATYAPEPYYAEALRRDPGDARCNNAMGLLLYRRARFAEAETYFRAALQRLTLRNPNPYDGEVSYNLGLALKMQGRARAAFDAFYKAAWNAAWQGPAYFELARLAASAAQKEPSANPSSPTPGATPDCPASPALSARLEDAVELARRSLHCGWTNHRARHLLIALLRRLGRAEEARAEIELALRLDPLEYGALWERGLTAAGQAAPPADVLDQAAHSNPHAFTALAIDYAHAGLFPEALAVLAAAPQADPLVHYYAGWIQLQAGKPADALAAFQRAAALPVGGCFPNTLESVLALQDAQRANPCDGHAPYLLGNFWYAHRRYTEAIFAWESAAEFEPPLAPAFRNLGLAYFNKLADAPRARAAYATAHRLAPGDARIFFELDQLDKKLNLPPAERLARLAARPDLVEARDDLTIEWVNLLLILGRHAEALQILSARQFHPWEGGEGKITGAYVNCLIESARESLAAGRPAAALEALERARVYPANLGEGKLPGALENHIFYYLGLANAALKRPDAARECFERASTGLSEPASAVFYNDQPPQMIFYQGLALRRLRRAREARAVFTRLVRYGQAHRSDRVAMDYFAVSLPDFLVFDEDLPHRNLLHCRFMTALGLLGLGKLEQARLEFDALLALDADHTGAHLHRRLAE